MKKTKTSKNNKDEMRSENDLSGKTGVRGKYYQEYRRGHTVRIHKANGTLATQHFTLQEGHAGAGCQEIFPKLRVA